MAVEKIRFTMRRGTAAEWASTNDALLSGEWGFETDTGKLKIGPGNWNSVPYFSSGDTGGIAEIVAGAGIIVDDTDPSRPIVAATGGSPVSRVTLNPHDAAPFVVVAGNGMTVMPPTYGPASRSDTVRATMPRAAGKWYFEARYVAGGGSVYSQVGVTTGAAVLAGQSVGGGGGWSYYQQTGNKNHGSTSVAFGSQWTLVDSVVGVALDCDAGNLWFALNNTWQASGDPAGGANPAFTGVTGTLYPAISIYSSNGSSITAAFASGDLRYAPPTGFAPWDS